MNKFKVAYVIDDDKIVHFVIRKLLANLKMDINLSFFYNGLEAIEKISNDINAGSDLPDLILLDINMPIMDGWQFLDEFRKFNKGSSSKTHVYIISSSDSNSDINKAKEYQDQIKEYILKPITKADLKKIFSLENVEQLSNK